MRSLSDDDAREIVEFREVLDAAAIRLACSRLTDEASATLELHIDNQQHAPTLSQLTLMDIEFHEQIVYIAGNSRLLAARAPEILDALRRTLFCDIVAPSVSCPVVAGR